MRADRPSTTAALIAAATIFIAHDSRFAGLVPSGAAEISGRCLREAGCRSWAEAIARPGLRWTARLAERLTLPGLLLHFVLRKRWIEDIVRQYLAAGSDEVVVVGAGFDTLAARLAPEFPRVQFVEIDHPATQRCKQRAIERVDFIGADLASVPLHELARPGPWSVTVIEGLLMYLSTEQCQALLASIGGAIVFTQIEPDASGAPRFHNATPLVRALLATWREPFRSAWRRDRVGEMMSASGRGLRAVADHELLRARYCRDVRAALARGEVCYAADAPGAQANTTVLRSLTMTR